MEIQRRNLIDYFKKNLSKGYTMDSLKLALTNQGYSRSIVETTSNLANKELAKKAPILVAKPEIKHEIIDRDNNPVIITKPWWKRILGL